LRESHFPLLWKQQRLFAPVAERNLVIHAKNIFLVHIRREKAHAANGNCAPANVIGLTILRLHYQMSLLANADELTRQTSQSLTQEQLV
jgi:hypothetical protein